MFYGKLQSDGFITNGKGNQFFQYIFSIEEEMLDKGVESAKLVGVPIV